MKIVEAELKTLMEGGKSTTEIANYFGCSPRAVQSWKARLARQGFSPDHDMVHQTAPGFMLKGTSTLYGKEGTQKLQWVKTKYDPAMQEEFARAFIEGISSEVPREEPSKGPAYQNEERLNLFPFTDYHLGMLAWAEESGDDWDLSIAEDLAIRWVSEAIATAPKAGTAILANMGDFLHWDGLDAVTPTSRHVLDADTRYTKLVRCAMRVIRRLVNMLLATHQHVHVIMAEGNHDEASSVWLREALTLIYENEPRLTLDASPDPYYCYEFGNTALTFHHGHKANFNRVESAILGKFRDVFGRTKYMYCHLGHLHHKHVKETSTMIIEQHQTLAAKDAYASRGGWLSQRSASVITYHKEFGEIARNTLTPEMFVINH